jgi:hypothetical protein
VVFNGVYNEPFRFRMRYTLLILTLVSLLTTTHDRDGQAELTVDAPRSLEAAAERVRNVDQAAFSRSLALAGLPMPRPIVITLVARDDPRAASTPSWVVGLANGTSDIRIFPDRIGAYPHDSLETVVRHEIVHLALNTRAGGRPLPRWFHEGVAVTIESGWGARDEMRLLLAALDPPSLADITRLFASDAYADTTQAYLLSAALANDVRERHGMDVPGRIAGQIASGMPFDAGFRAVTGGTVEDAAAHAWRGYRQVSRWVPVATSPSTVWTLILVLSGLAFVVRLRRRGQLRRQWDEEQRDDPDDPPLS